MTLIQFLMTGEARNGTRVESRYLEYSISRTLDVSDKTIGPILINLHKMTTRYVELSMSLTNLLVP